MFFVECNCGLLSESYLEIRAFDDLGGSGYVVLLIYIPQHSYLATVFSKEPLGRTEATSSQLLISGGGTCFYHIFCRSGSGSPNTLGHMSQHATGHLDQSKLPVGLCSSQHKLDVILCKVSLKLITDISHGRGHMVEPIHCGMLRPWSGLSGI